MPRTAIHDLINDSMNIDILPWHRGGHLVPGNQFANTWSRRGQIVMRALINVRKDYLILRYQTLSANRGWIETRQAVALAWSRCRFGGERPFFVCTANKEGNHCGRQATKLYPGSDGVFACRRCQGLSYECQREPLLIRGVGVAQKIRERLGGHQGLNYPFPAKPKGMHWRTYHRLKRQHDDIDARCCW